MLRFLKLFVAALLCVSFVCSTTVFARNKHYKAAHPHGGIRPGSQLDIADGPSSRPPAQVFVLGYWFRLIIIDDTFVTTASQAAKKTELNSPQSVKGVRGWRR